MGDMRPDLSKVDKRVHRRGGELSGLGSNIDQPAVGDNRGVGPDGKFDLGLCFN